jgi:hypothetical protein
MSDQSLSDAVEAALDRELCTCDECEEGDYNAGVRAVLAAVRRVLADHQAETNEANS